MPDDIDAKIENFESKMKLLNDHFLKVSFELLSMNPFLLNFRDDF